MMTEWAAAAMKLLLWGALMAADIDLPPTKYDHPYRGQVEYAYDFPIAVTADGQKHPELVQRNGATTAAFPPSTDTTLSDLGILRD
jgi:hypothetical protein